MVGKPTETESRMEVSRGLAGSKDRKILLNGYRVPACGNETFGRWTVVIITQQSECAGCR